MCGLKKYLCDFYSKGSRVDSKCKDCIKSQKAKKYQMKSKRSKQYENNRINEVIIVPNPRPDTGRLRDEMLVVESIITNFMAMERQSTGLENAA